MAQELYKNLNGLRICVAGAGVTGLAVARSLTKRGVEVTLIDENKTSTDEFPVVHPDAITITDFDRLLISPGWKESHPVIQAARAAQVPAHPRVPRTRGRRQGHARGRRAAGRWIRGGWRRAARPAPTASLRRCARCSRRSRGQRRRRRRWR